MGPAGAALQQPLLGKGNSKRSEGFTSLTEGSAGSSILLLTSAGIGTGVLALPYGVKCVGIIPATALFAIAGIAGFASNVILFRCSHKTGLGSYGELMTSILGKNGAMVLDAFVFLEGYGAVATYLVFLMDFVPQLCALGGDDMWCTDRSNVLALSSCIIWPLSCLKGLSALRYTSTCSIATVIFTSIVVVIKSPALFARTGHTFSEAVTQMNLDMTAFQVLSMACFAFMVHTNTPEIARQLRSPSRARFKKVVGAHTFALWGVYTVIALCRFLSFMEETGQDFLSSYEVRDFLAVCCRLMLSGTLVLACPINIFPSAQALFNILEGLRASSSKQDGERLYDRASVRVPVNTLCFAMAVGIAKRTPKVADLIGTMSSFATSPLMFAFPAVMYWRILGGKDWAIPCGLLLLTAALWLAEILRLLQA